MSSGQCAERAGFLFKHACEGAGLRECQRCGKSICAKHTVHVDASEGALGQSEWCVSCAKRVHQHTRDSHDSDSGYYNYGYDNRPYFYGASYYAGWGHRHYDEGNEHDAGAGVEAYDADDFTEADGAATEMPGDEGFETDMEGS